MGPSNIRLESSNLDALIREQLTELRAGRVDARRVLLLGSYQRQRACASLLLGLDTADFGRRLVKVGLGYLFLLDRRSSLQSPDPYYLARSKGTALFDALAAGDLSLTRDIAEKSPAKWTEGMEDEDDFRYMAAVASLAEGPASVTAAPALDELKRSLGGAASARASVLLAVQQRDHGAFEEALEALLLGWANRAEKARKSSVASPYFVNIEAHICIEGLALVRLARQHGLSTAEAYPFVPKEALTVPELPARPSLWEDLGSS